MIIIKKYEAFCLIQIYNALCYNKNSELYRNKLLKYSLTFLSFDFGKQLFAFASGLLIEPFANSDSLMSCMSSSINNPKLLSLQLGNRQETVIKKYDIFIQSPSLQINKLIGGLDIQDIKIQNKSELQTKE